MHELGSSLNQASLGLILVTLCLTQLGLPIPETPFIVAAGVVAQRAGHGVAWPIAACCGAVLLGDWALYRLASKFGQAAFRRAPLRWMLPPSAQPRVETLFEKHGAMTIFVARFISGVRAMVFILAGMGRIAIWRFLIWDGLAVAVTVPIFATLGFTFADRVTLLDAHVANTQRVLIAVCALAIVGYSLSLVWAARSKREG
ncbi:MAG TPA: DedA family protein [Polyangiaceae bacterium]|nr:DedA family protein [Polyangiaceae bacterium]